MVALLPLLLSLAMAPPAPARQTPAERADALVAGIEAALQRPVTDAGAA
jgi:hypothetical protein